MATMNDADNPFRHMYTDRRFEAIKWRNYNSTNALDDNQRLLNFHVPALDGPNAMLVNSIMLFVGVQLTRADGHSVPAKLKQVGPKNNVLHTMIKQLVVHLNEIPITPGAPTYPFKAYFVNTLSYGDQAKFSWMCGEGYSEDVADNFDDTTGTKNAGFQLRREKFLLPDGKTYSGDTFFYCGKLITDLVGCSTPLMPGVSLSVNITLADDDSVLLCPIGDNERYKLKLKVARLLVPIATISRDLFERFQKDHEKQPVRMYFTRSSVRTKTIPVHSSSYTSDKLFGPAVPTKVIVAFTPTSRLSNNYHANPYAFHRRWPKGRGSVYLKRVDLQLNGESVDGFDNTQTEHDATLPFLRLHHYLGKYGKQADGNHINLEKFLGGYGFFVFDLSTCGQSGMEGLIPAVRTGDYRLLVEFSDPIDEGITIIVYMEHPSLIEIKKSGVVNLDYSTQDA